MTHDEIFAKVKDILVDALAADEDDVTAQAKLTKDLGAESIDFLDIVFKLEQGFGIKINQGEFFPDDIAKNPQYVKEGKVTGEGLAALRTRMPHVDFTAFEKDPSIGKIGELFTVDTVVKFVDAKLKAKG
jgi:acyl carrier protein